MHLCFSSVACQVGIAYRLASYLRHSSASLVQVLSSLAGANDRRQKENVIKKITLTHIKGPQTSMRRWLRSYRCTVRFLVINKCIENGILSCTVCYEKYIKENSFPKLFENPILIRHLGYTVSKTCQIQRLATALHYTIMPKALKLGGLSIERISPTPTRAEQLQHELRLVH